MTDWTKRSGSRIAMGIGAGLALGVTVGPLLVWLPIGVVFGVLWEKKR